MEAHTTYHAAYAFWSLKGVLAERWGHGPIFGAFSETGDRVLLSPALEEVDRNIAAIYGLRTSGLNAEGPHWVGQAPRLAERWLADVYQVLKPKKTVRVRVDLTAIYPIRDPDRASEALRARFYDDSNLRRLVPDRYEHFHAAVDWLATEGSPQMSCVLGVIGPAHQGAGLFAFDDSFLSDQWWMGVRLSHVEQNEEQGLEDPAARINHLIKLAYEDVGRVARVALPAIVS